MLYTSPRAEKQVARRIAAEGKEVYLPLHIVKRKWSDRVKRVEVPLFNSYVFVKVEERELGTLLLINGVSRVVYYLHRPAVVRDSEIVAVKEFLVHAAEKDIIRVSDEVEVKLGCFANRGGRVLYITEKEVALYLEELGAKICVKRELVEKVVKK